MRARLEVPALVLGVVTGVWLLAAPELLGLEGGARLSQLVVGPIAASVAAISLSPVVRTLVRVNAPLGAWLVAAPILLDHGGAWPASVAAGLVLAGTAVVPTSRAEWFAGGWASLVNAESTGPARTTTTEAEGS